MYGEVFVPMPSYGPRDRADWVERVRMGNHPVSNYLILFEPEVAAQAEHANTSCPSVFMTDCILNSGNQRTIMRDAEEPIFAAMKDKGYQEIRFILRVSYLCGVFGDTHGLKIVPLPVAWLFLP
jgi:hypothetical protein